MAPNVGLQAASVRGESRRRAGRGKLGKSVMMDTNVVMRKDLFPPRAHIFLTMAPTNTDNTTNTSEELMVAYTTSMIRSQDVETTWKDAPVDVPILGTAAGATDGGRLMLSTL